MRRFVTLVVATTVTIDCDRGRPSRHRQKPSVDVHAQAKLDSPKIKTLPRDSEVTITAQEGLWYQLKLEKPGYVRVNDVRIAYAGRKTAMRTCMRCSPAKAGKAT